MKPDVQVKCTINEFYVRHMMQPAMKRFQDVACCTAVADRGSQLALTLAD